ncbi:MAG TPA: hypothetical protein VM368_02120 [Flavisolibacter sp.]|nr:hypothetical protein [Flavisolibacter sp.]
MLKKIFIVMVFFLASHLVYSQTSFQKLIIEQNDTSLIYNGAGSLVLKQFTATSEFLDAAINSINSFTSLIKKENYRNKITSLNNPTSSDMGFNLENEIQTALKPLLAKAKNTNSEKFAQVVSTFFTAPTKTAAGVTKTATPVFNPVYSTLLSLVGNLAIQEKKITRDDLDSFINTTAKYFVQYEKLNQANYLFDQNIDRINTRLAELQFDLKEYMLDLTAIIHKTDRSNLKKINAEELFLKYLDKQKLEFKVGNLESNIHYPSDGLKSAKDIANNLQKLFNEYQRVYNDNYQQIRTILSDSKRLGKNINTRQVDASLKDLEELYNDSKNADVLSLRLNTLSERLKVLAEVEQTSLRTQ